MIVHLILGFALGIIGCAIFINYIVPLIQIKQDVYQYKQTDIANQYNLNTQKMNLDFQREYPEVKGNSEPVHAIGYHMDTEDYCDDEEDMEDRKIGFKIK
jgi:hypothetical protein